MSQVSDQLGHELPLAEACALAGREGWRQRVLVYVTRVREGQAELLVFARSGGPEIPAGGVEPGEYPEQTAIRETWEESGLKLHGPVHLASHHWTRAGTSQVWHTYWLAAPPGTPGTWTHTVTGGGQDAGKTLHYHWTPLDHPDLVAGHRFEEALPALRTLMAQTLMAHKETPA